MARIISYDQYAQSITGRWMYHHRQYDRPVENNKINVPVSPVSSSGWGMRSVNRPEVMFSWLGASQWGEPVSRKIYQERTVNGVSFPPSTKYRASDAIPASDSDKGKERLGNQSLWELHMAEDRYRMEGLQRHFDVLNGQALQMNTNNNMLLESALEAQRQDTAQFIIDNMNDDVEVRYESGSEGKHRKQRKTYICWNKDASGHWTRHEYRIG